jgi:anthranilate synthase/aminodeoxychorismate synthase-like glutamine amidotransferase
MPLKILIIDNFDSFTYNLVHLAGTELLRLSTGADITVLRNNEINSEKIQQLGFERIIVSPGPGSCTDGSYFGNCMDILQTASTTIPTLGICLGMQGIACAFGGKVNFAQTKMHGKLSPIIHEGHAIFDNLPQNIQVMRYHSQIVEKNSLPNCLIITSTSVDDSEVMALRHTTLPIQGVQFHPESHLTQGGHNIMANFLIQKYYV